MTKTKVAVAMGGYSSEFEISINSGNIVCDHLDTNLYDVYPVHILKEGWFHVSKDGKRHPVSKENFSFSDGEQIIIPNVLFNTVHGTPGEDGHLASFCELIGLPQTSAGFYEAALSFNKRDCLSVLKKLGVKCATSVYLNEGDVFSSSEILETVGLPCFVKANRAGSSFGISKVHTLEQFEPALAVAFKEDNEVIIESTLVGTEVSVGVFKAKGELQVFSPTEIVSENDFFDYEAKYQGKSQEITPARISDAETKIVQAEAKRIHQLLNMKGITRSDFIIQNGVPYFIEINTTPGLSAESIVPKQAKEAGLKLSTFFAMLIEETLS